MDSRQNTLNAPLAKAMKQAGFNVTKRGICFGAAMMSVQAYAISDHQHFLQRLKHLQAKLAENSDSIFTHDEFAFLSGTAIYQQSTKHPHLFTAMPTSQYDIEATHRLVQSIMLEAAGGLKIMHAMVDSFTPESCHAFFATLNGIARSTQQSFSLLLGGCGHTVAMHYVANEHAWHFFDIGDMPVNVMKIDQRFNVAELARWAWCKTQRKTEPRYITMTVHIITTAKQYQHLQVVTNHKMKNYYNLFTLRNDKGRKKLTPAHLAARYGMVDHLVALHQAGANLNARDQNRNTPAMTAAKHGHTDVIKALIQLKVKMDAVNAKGGTAAIAARINGHHALAALIEQHIESNIKNKPIRTSYRFFKAHSRRFDSDMLINHLPRSTGPKSPLLDETPVSGYDTPLLRGA